MKRLLSICLALLLLLSVLPPVTATETVPCLTVDSSLVIIGDSNTVFLKKNNPDIQAARIYARVSATIQEAVENYSYYADGYNYGICQLVNALDGSSFDTVIINMGTNNLGSSIPAYKSNYKKLLDRLYGKNPNAVIYCCKILPINPYNYGGPYYNAITLENVDKINAAVAEVQQEYAAQGYDARIMDLHTPFSNAYGVLLDRYDSGGGIHLTTSGYHYLNTVIQTALAQGDPAANHSWNSGTVLTAPSCGANGEKVYSCSVCDARKTEAIPATGAHSWDEGRQLRAPGCTEEGVYALSCTVCGSEIRWAIPALGHCWSFQQTLTEGETLHDYTGKFVCFRCWQSKEARLCASEVFTDMPEEDHWAHNAIDWLYFSGLTSGTTPTTFSPDGTLDRAQALTFLWALRGRPQVEAENPFTDVTEADYFCAPVLWAVAKGVTYGTTPTTFSPTEPCLRAQIVTFLWAYAGSPEPATTENPFEDVSEADYFYKPVLWAVEKGVTYGVDETHFAPAQPCTRAQMAAFLHALVIALYG